MPAWRHPAALVAYGVVGALVLVLALGGDDEPEAPIVFTDGAAPDSLYEVVEVPAGTTRDAFTVAQYEELIAEGERSVGDVVRTELYCGSIEPVAVREIDDMNPALIALTDTEGRVAGAECRWGRENRSADFLLVVPPSLAEDFARAPEEELNFIRRRRIPALVEWLGRSEPLALRTSGVLREITAF